MDQDPDLHLFADPDANLDLGPELKNGLFSGFADLDPDWYLQLYADLDPDPDPHFFYPGSAFFNKILSFRLIFRGARYRGK